VQHTNLTVYVASRHPTFSPAATTAVANSTTRRANPFVVLVGFHHIFSISIKSRKGLPSNLTQWLTQHKAECKT